MPLVRSSQGELPRVQPWVARSGLRLLCSLTSRRYARSLLPFWLGRSKALLWAEHAHLPHGPIVLIAVDPIAQLRGRGVHARMITVLVCCFRYN